MSADAEETATAEDGATHRFPLYAHYKCRECRNYPDPKARKQFCPALGTMVGANKAACSYGRKREPGDPVADYASDVRRCGCGAELKNPDATICVACAVKRSQAEQAEQAGAEPEGDHVSDRNTKQTPDERIAAARILVAFVDDMPGRGKWPERLEAWNAAHPERTFSTASSFQKTYHASRRHLREVEAAGESADPPPAPITQSPSAAADAPPQAAAEVPASTPPEEPSTAAAPLECESRTGTFDPAEVEQKRAEFITDHMAPKTLEAVCGVGDRRFWILGPAGEISEAERDLLHALVDALEDV